MLIIYMMNCPITPATPASMSFDMTHGTSFGQAFPNWMILITLICHAKYPPSLSSFVLLSHVSCMHGVFSLQLIEACEETHTWESSSGIVHLFGVLS